MTCCQYVVNNFLMFPKYLSILVNTRYCVPTYLTYGTETSSLDNKYFVHCWVAWSWYRTDTREIGSPMISWRDEAILIECNTQRSQLNNPVHLCCQADTPEPMGKIKVLKHTCNMQLRDTGWINQSNWSSMCDVPQPHLPLYSKHSETWWWKMHRMGWADPSA